MQAGSVSCGTSLLLVDCGLPKQWGNPFPHRSLGILSCREFLQRHGIAAGLAPSEDIGVSLPFNAEAVADFVRNTAAAAPDFIGFSTTSDSLPIVLYLAEQVRQRQKPPYSKMLFGGIGASSYPLRLLEHYPFIDVIVVGEGEETLLELIKTGTHPDKWGEIAGLAYRDHEGKVRMTATRPRWQAMELLPIPYSVTRYHVQGYVRERHTCFAVTSRGCTGHCRFCSHSLIWKGKVTHHPAAQVLDLMHEVETLHPGAHLAFQDDDFLSSPEKVTELVSGVKQRGILVPWAIFGRLDRITTGILETLRRGNCDSIIFGLDTATEAGRRHLGKPWSFQDALPKLRLSQEYIPAIEINFIYGWAGESMAEFKKMLREAYALRLDGFQVKMAPLAVYPETPIHRSYRTRLQLIPNADIFASLLGEAYGYVVGHEDLYPNFAANSFDPMFGQKKNMLQYVDEAFTVYDEV